LAEVLRTAAEETRQARSARVPIAAIENARLRPIESVGAPFGERELEG